MKPPTLDLNSPSISPFSPPFQYPLKEAQPNCFNSSILISIPIPISPPQDAVRHHRYVRLLPPPSPIPRILLNPQPRPPIAASTELLTAFNHLVTDPSQRGILVTIQNESLVPLSTSLPASSSFLTDLAYVAPALQPTTPLYILLRQHESAPDGFVAVTYVPDAAPVRQKTLFAATRLTLVRALGAERFRTTRFVTEPAELAPDGWRRYELGEAADGPLTEEEKVLRNVKAEEEAGKNTTGRRQIVSGPVRMRISEEARGALEVLGRGEGENLVQLVGVYVWILFNFSYFCSSFFLSFWGNPTFYILPAFVPFPSLQIH